MIGVEQWAEITRLYCFEKRSKRAIRRLTGAHRDTITPASSRSPAREQLQADPTIQAQRPGDGPTTFPVRRGLGFTGSATCSA